MQLKPIFVMFLQKLEQWLRKYLTVQNLRLFILADNKVWKCLCLLVLFGER